MKRLLLLLIPIFLLSGLQSFATHIVGGELVYTHLGGDQYAVTLIVYRDCLSGQAAFDNPAPVGVYDANNNLLQDLNFSLDSVVTLQSTINSSCVTAPNDVCTEAGYYTQILTLPPTTGGYTIAYQRCCRNAVVQNIQSPGDVGATYVATVPGTESSPDNTSPFWNNLPPLYVCVNLPFEFDHSAFDLDGDSLVYSLCTPFEGGSPIAPAPNPPPGPPYAPVSWLPPFGINNMLGGTFPLTIDSETGQINAVPDAQGTFLIGLCVQEYRNGVLLGETRRGIQINVVNCQAPVASPDDLNEIIPNSFTNCTEFVEFEASNSSGFDIIWDFGDPTTTADVSNDAITSWTYPGPGSYDLTLIVFNPINPTDPLCTDTVIQTITIQDTVLPVAGSDTLTCPGVAVQIGDDPVPGWTYNWSPSVGLDNPNSAQPLANITSQTAFVVTAFDAVGCSGTDTVFVSLGNSGADAGPDVVICPGDTTQLEASGGVDYQWSPNISISNVNIPNPIVFPNTPQDYVVSVTNADGCIGTDTVLVDFFQSSVSVSSDQTICIGDTTQIEVFGTTTFSWSPSDSLSDVGSAAPLVWPSEDTYYVLEAETSDGCDFLDSVLVAVQDLPTAFAGFDQGVCSAGTAQLNATGGVTYQWSPAEGLSNPNIPDPIVTFTTDTVTYSVLVTDALGCENSDTVTIWQEPLPDATAGPDTTICVGESVQLFSGGGISFAWEPAAGLNNPTVQNPTATPQTTTTYTVTVGQPTGNLLFNGDFSQGNTGFSSDYTYYDGPPNMGEALYSVVTDASSIHNAFEGTGHTGNAPQDSFMVVNGAGTPNQDVWCQTVSVSPNTDYFFGAWVSTVFASSPAILQFSINGQVLGAPFTAPFNTNNWIQFFETWNSGTATTATICILNQNTNTGGNDFALDDITFSTFCTNTAEVTVTVNPIPEADAGEDQQICIGDTTQLEGSGGATYAWVPPINLEDPTDPNTAAYPLQTRTYTLIVEDNIGCSDTDEMTLTVNPLPPANAGPDQAVCEGESVILQGTGGTDYQWTPSTYLDDPNSQLPVSTPESTITYRLTVTNSNNCSATDSVTVTLNALPTVDAGLDSLICPNGSLVLQASGAENYSWTPLVGLSDPQSATPTASPLEPTTFFVTGTDINGCVNSDSVNITVYSVPANSGDYVICVNDSVQASVSGGVSFSWNPTTGVSDVNSSEPFLSPELTTDYTVAVTSAFGCVAETEVSVQVLSVPIAAFSGSFDATCEGIFAQFDNQSLNSESYSWSFGNGVSSSDFEPFQIYENGAGPVVTLYAFNNDSLCVDSITIDYSTQWFSNDSIEVEYTNIFTPNNDGLNDCFKPEVDGRFSDCYELKVFNRWGALIFESIAGQNHCWDGRTKGGLMVPEGTYYYISNVLGIEHAGYVTVIYE